MIKLAIVDDHELFRSGFVSILKGMENMQVIMEADNGLELFTKLEKIKKDGLPDVCALDIDMPQCNGYDALSRLKKEYPDIGVLIISVYTDEEAILKAFRLGAHGYLFKDTPTGLLFNAIEMVAGGQYAYPSIDPKKLNIYGRGNSLLTDKELELIRFSCTDLGYKEIATKMHTNLRSIHYYRTCIFDKLDIHSRSGMILYALTTGLVPLETYKQLKKENRRNE